MILNGTWTRQYGSYHREGRWGVLKGEGSQYMVAEDDLTVGGGYTMRYTGDGS